MAEGSYVADFEQAVQWLADAWDSTSADWNDRVRSDFEADYWAPMTRAASVFGEQLQGLATALDQARTAAP